MLAVILCPHVHHLKELFQKISFLPFSGDTSSLDANHASYGYINTALRLYMFGMYFACKFSLALFLTLPSYLQSIFPVKRIT